MSYPEKGATYHHRPKFIERAMAEEKRATGGEVKESTPAPRGGSKSDDEGLSDFAMRLAPIPLPSASGKNTGDNMGADVSVSHPEFLRGLTPR